MYKLYADGGFQSYNRQIVVGIMIQRKKGLLLQYGKKLSVHGSNNEAEYWALIVGLRECLKKNVLSVSVFMDSQLVINQMMGSWCINSPALAKLNRKAKNLSSKFKKIRYNWVPRGTKEIKIVDKLGSEAKNG